VTPVPPVTSAIAVANPVAAATPSRPATTGSTNAAAAAASGDDGDSDATDGSAEAAPSGQAPTQLSAAALVVQQAANSGTTGGGTSDKRGDPTSDAVSATSAATVTSDAVLVGQQPHVAAAAPGTPAAADSSTNLAASLHPASEQLAASLKQAASNGDNSIHLELSPPSLGKIDVHLDFGSDGKLNAVISADRPETLSLLSGDAKTLTQSLRDAGVQVDNSSLSFNLRGDGSNPGQRQFAQSSFYGSAGASGEDDDGMGALGAIAASATRSSHAGNLDIQV
jgi:flagellar hook-length control protein FliK